MKYVLNTLLKVSSLQLSEESPFIFYLSLSCIKMCLCPSLQLFFSLNLVCFSHGLMISLLSYQTISLALFFFFPWPVMHRLPFLCFVNLFIFLFPSVLCFSTVLCLCHHLWFCLFTVQVLMCVCVCHSTKILLTCGLVCLPFGSCSFILALAADGMYVSGRGDRWRSALKSNFMTLKATPSVFLSALYLDIGQQRMATQTHISVG